jgi:hypothetical protein
MSTHPYTRLFILPSPPDADNDETEGYEIGDTVHVTGGSIYVCRDPSTGAAVWEEQTSGGSLPADVDVAETFKLSGIISATLTGDHDDWNPTGLADASIIRITGSAGDGISGIQGGADGRVLSLLNVGASGDYIVLANESIGSLAANRFLLPDTLNLYPNKGIILIYDGTSGGWRQLSREMSVAEILAVTDTMYAPASKGVLNGNSHDHLGGDGGAIAYSSLSGAEIQDPNTYAPTCTGVANVDSTSAVADFTYLRLGSAVIASGNLNCDATAAGVVTRIRVTIPVASNFGSTGNLTGIGGISGSDDVVIAQADTVNDAAEVIYTANGTANTVIRILFMYPVLP